MAESSDRNKGKPDEPPVVPTIAYGRVGLGPGAQIGPYKLLSILGEGGYGIIYLAEQHEPIRRHVALKVIKPGMDTKQVIARFEAERQALALLDHPHIAHVFDAGTQDGRPYFVMECVKGVPITEHCDRYKLNIEGRLELFLMICEAVQHAHQKGIIHRDIKPSNILVTIEGDRPNPMVIDFGVAKALSQSLTDRTLVTEQAQMIGTPEYMSPEQAEMTSQDIDTRSDIYSLGVVLYELLTGVLPFEPQSLRAGGPDHIRRTIREEDPKTPSTRLSGVTAEESTRLAQLRQTDVRTLSRRLHGDLDWITLKAMEKDRIRRYASVGELAADITRHLRHEPVLAGPPSALYRARKCIRRHQALATGAAAVFLVLLVGVVGIAAFAIKADRQARTAQAVTDFLGEDLLGAVALQQAMSQEVTVRSIIDAAAARLEGEFADKPLVEASIRQYLGRTYIELGDYRQAEPYLVRACELRRRQLGDDDRLTLDSMSQLGRLHLLQGRYAEAEPLLAQALESRRRLLGSEHADTLLTSIWLGLVYKNSHQSDSFQRAEPLLTSAFESCNRLFGKEAPITLEAMYGLASLHFGGPGQESQALPLCFEGWEIARKVLGEGHRLTFDFMVMGAWLQAWTGRFEEAERNAQVGIETGRRVLGEAHPQTIMALGTLGEVYLMQHRFGEAQEPTVEAVRLASQTLGRSNEWTLKHRVGLGRTYMMQGKYQEAERQFMEAQTAGRSVYTDSYPIVREAANNIISLYTMQERSETLERWCQEELGRLSQLGDTGRPLRAHVHNALAWYQATYPSEAIRDGAKAIENAKKACELTDYDVPNYIDTLAAAYAETGDFVAAVREERVAAELTAGREVTSRFDQFLEFHLRLFESGHVIREGVLSWRARTMLREAKYGSTERELAAALKSARQYLGESHPETLGCMLCFIELYEAWNRPDEAAKWRQTYSQATSASESD